ncbi:DUF4230 domain-containing protein [Leptolyngbya sp. NK1-12]|uniref:DUF4230 domain-containing protein n=1 Tax=Leptolyngbya sp. NK1-12 TaxID=2547451 RepID=A0AA96WUJ1_9CYAN|nr:DUF4230 domain-containing protein [Leptolyngbya sp. NK1-12]WNZ23547.1 DUF4230 domain-containing protein [Leptolyngbya sp. NK1-12]
MGINQTQQKRRNLDWAVDRTKDLSIAAERKKSGQWLGFLFKNLSLMATGGALMLGFLSLIGIWHTGSQFLNNLRSWFTVAEPPAKVDVRSTVVQQVRGASELTTAVYSMESVVPTSRERTIGGYVIGKTTLLYIAHGEVRAGVDLAALQPNDVQVSDNAILLRLPPPKILDSKIDVNRSQVYDYDRGFLGLGPDVAPELQELAQRETLSKIVAAACTDGVLQSANERAKLAVSQLLTTAGYSQFTIETQTPSLEACIASNAPASVVPSAPLPSGTVPPPPPVPSATPPSSVTPETIVVPQQPAI